MAEAEFCQPPHACRQSSSLLHQPHLLPLRQNPRTNMKIHVCLCMKNVRLQIRQKNMTWLASHVQLSSWLPIHQGCRSTQRGIHHSNLPYVMKVSPSKAGPRHAQEDQPHLILQAVLQGIQRWKIRWFQLLPLKGTLPLIWEYYFRGRYGLSVSIKVSGGKPIPMGTISFFKWEFLETYGRENSIVVSKAETYRPGMENM